MPVDWDLRGGKKLKKEGKKLKKDMRVWVKDFRGRVKKMWIERFGTMGMKDRHYRRLYGNAL